MAVDLLRVLEFKNVSLPVDVNGLHVEKLESILQQHRPKRLHMISNFRKTRARLHVRRAAMSFDRAGGPHDLPISEDDFVADLRYNYVVPSGCYRQRQDVMLAAINWKTTFRVRSLDIAK